MTIKDDLEVKSIAGIIDTKRYTRKRFDVDAVEVTAENISDVAKWCQGEVRTEEHQVGYKDRTTVVHKYIKVRVHRPANDGQTKAFIGDFVLYAGTGFKVYSPRAFENSFDPADDSPEQSENVAAEGMLEEIFSDKP